MLTTMRGATRACRRQHLLVAGDHDVAAEHEIGAAGGDADGVDVVRLVRDADVAVDRAALLREAGHVDDADALAFEMRRHAEHRADGDDAGAADAGDDDAVGLADRRQHRIRGSGKSAAAATASRFFRLCAVHGHEGRAEALHAGKVLVAARLIDGALAAPFGLQRLHRDAIRFHAAIAAALADQFVDDHALVGIGERAALAAAAFFGGAGLVVDQDGAARDRGEFASARRRDRRGDGS